MRYYSGGSLFAGLFGNQQIVSVAMGQLGNSGGQKFWSWYGFESRVEWCACFASWCAEQSGMVASGQVLKFSSCAVGASWFQGQGRWKGKGYTPSAGDFIFFDWNKDGQVDHVGIVVNVANGRVNTIEGNTSNMVARRSYQLGGNSDSGIWIYINSIDRISSLLYIYNNKCYKYITSRRLI